MAATVFGSHYTVSVLITNPGAVANLGVQSHATRMMTIIYASIEPAQAALVTEAGAALQLARKTAAPTYTAIAATTFMNHDGGGSDAGFTAGHTASAQGTTGDVIARGWNSKVGFEWRPTPEEYITVPAGVANGFAVIHTVAPPAGVYAFTLTVVEVG
jgi:roadblock/LC7 domain-containing protein